VATSRVTQPTQTELNSSFPDMQVERMDLNVAKWQMDSRVKLRVIGQSLDGRDINLLQIGVRGCDISQSWLRLHSRCMPFMRRLAAWLQDVHSLLHPACNTCGTCSASYELY